MDWWSKCRHRHQLGVPGTTLYVWTQWQPLPPKKGGGGREPSEMSLALAAGNVPACPHAYRLGFALSRSPAKCTPDILIPWTVWVGNPFGLSLGEVVCLHYNKSSLHIPVCMCIFLRIQYSTAHLQLNIFFCKCSTVKCCFAISHSQEIRIQIAIGPSLCGVCMFFKCLWGFSFSSPKFIFTQKCDLCSAVSWGVPWPLR